MIIFLIGLILIMAGMGILVWVGYRSLVPKPVIDINIFKMKTNKPKKSNYELKNVYSANKLEEKYDCVVIGSGISGLTSAILAAKAGMKVLVLEQHDILGGCLHTFEEDGYEMDTGLHYIGGMAEGAMARVLMDSLTDSRVTYHKMGTYFDQVVIGEKGEFKHKHEGSPQKFKEGLIKRFPEEKRAIEAFMNVINDIRKDNLGYFILKFAPSFLKPILKICGMGSTYMKYANMTYKQVCKQVGIKDQKLYATLGYIFGDYGTDIEKSPFSTHAIVLNHYISSGSYYPIGGPQKMAQEMVATIRAHGGELMTMAKVEEIMTLSNKVAGVKMERDKHIINAKIVISSAGIINTFGSLLKNKKIKSKCIKSYAKPSIGHFCVYLGLDTTDENIKLPPFNSWWLGTEDFDKQYQNWMSKTKPPTGELNYKDLPPLFISFPSSKDPTWEKRHPNKAVALILAPVPYKWFEPYENLRIKQRGSDYTAIKSNLEKAFLDQTLKLFPEIDPLIAYVDSSTPLSSAYYLNSAQGASYGMALSHEREMDLSVNADTPITNLYVTGQDLICAGVVSALMSGVVTMSSVLSRNLMNDLIDVVKEKKKSLRQSSSQ